MEKLKVAIFENNDELTVELKNLIAGCDDMEICATAVNGNSALEAVRRTAPDVAVVDLVLCGLDGFGVLDYIRKNNPGCECIALSSYINDKTVNRAIELGASYYLVKPIEADTILAKIRELTEEKSVPVTGIERRERRRGNSIDERLSGIFITIGIPPNIKGFSYLREGIKYVVNDPTLINNVTKVLYPMIADRFNTTSSKVERAIRHAIEVAWNRGRTDAISSVFGARVYVGTERPTNSEFIALVADKLILESLE